MQKNHEFGWAQFVDKETPYNVPSGKTKLEQEAEDQVVRDDGIFHVKQPIGFRAEVIDSIKRKVPKFYDEPGMIIKVLRSMVKIFDQDFNSFFLA